MSANPEFYNQVRGMMMSHKHLTESDREVLYRMLKCGDTQKAVAKALGVFASTISRELKRNSGGRGYRPRQAQRLADARKRGKSKAVKLTAAVKSSLDTLLRQQLSPQQCALYLSRAAVVSLHHETIYRYVYADKAAGGDLHWHLRMAGRAYRRRCGVERRGRIPHRVDISARPRSVERRRCVGHWEGDLVLGRGGVLLTLVERKAGLLRAAWLPDKRSAGVTAAVIRVLSPLVGKVRSITFDNGLEFAGHRAMAAALGARVYFARAYASWQRGCNENLNGLLRQYFPKGGDFAGITAAQVAGVQERLNDRPRERLGGKTPNEVFFGRRADLLAV